MDNPGISLFQGTDIKINNSKNIEEEEDLEDQLRRKEEIQNLLQANLDDFKYDESTINSSTNVSLASADNLEQLYKDAISPSEQLKVLLDVRCREINALKEEYDKFKAENTKEIESRKHQNLLLKAELRQLGISLKNAENLLVDKQEAINTLSKNVQEKDSRIHELEKRVNEQENDLATYKSELAEMHLKLQSQNGPFNLNSKYNSEELRQSLQSKIEKLATAFDQETKKLEACNLEKHSLEDEVARLALEKVALEKDNAIILKNMDGAQQQCKDLIDVIEVLKHENDHFKGRLNEIECTKDEQGSFGRREDSGNNEKLKKMLFDKSTELDSLKFKLRHYENDLKELIEYRQLKSDVYKKEFQKCDNPDHTKELILMQNELQNYRRIIEDKNQQILNLNSNNKDLKEKIEGMLLQTRNEIQNISSKYNMPQLEIMRKELEKAEYERRMLSKRLEESEERRRILMQKLERENDQNDTEALMKELQKCTDDLKRTEDMLTDEREKNLEMCREIEYLKTEIFRLKNELEELRIQLRKSKNNKISPSKKDKSEHANIKSDYDSLKNQLKNVMEYLEKNCHNNLTKKEHPEIVAEVKQQMDRFLEQVEKETIEKGLIEEQISSWKKLLDQIEIQDSEEILKTQYKEAVMNLHASEEKLKELEDELQDLKNLVTITEGEKCSLSVELNEYSKKLLHSESLRNNLERELDHLEALVKEKDEKLKKCEMPDMVDGGNTDTTDNRVGILEKEMKHLNELLDSKQKELTASLEVIKRYEQEKKELKKWFEKTQKENERLKNENTRLECDRPAAKKSVDKPSENDATAELEEEVVKCELKIRDAIQIEYQKRISDIETRYQKTFKETTELCKQQKIELDEQDKKFREYLKMILAECETCTGQLEKEKMDLAKQLQSLRDDYEKCKVEMVYREKKNAKMLKKMEREAQRNNDAWKLWSKKVVCSCLDIEATNKKVRDRVLASMEQFDQEVAAIQKLADKKIERKSSKKEKK